MATARQLCLERLSATAASAGERGSSVLELITLFNAFFEAHTGDQTPPNCANEARASSEPDDVASESRAIGVKPPPTSVRKASIPIPIQIAEEDEQVKMLGLDDQSPSWFDALATLIRTALLSVWQLLPRVWECFQASMRSFVSIFMTAGRSQSQHDRPEDQSDGHEDAAMVAVIRLAIELESAHRNAIASRLECYDHEMHLAAVHARLAKLSLNDCDSASARRFHEQLCEIARASKGTESDLMTRDLGCASVWV